MNATSARASVIFCALAAGCGAQDDGNSLSGTSLTTGFTTFGNEEEDEDGETEESSTGDGDGDGDSGDGDGDSGEGDGESGDGDGDSGDGDGDSGDGDGDSGDGDGDVEPYSAVGPQTDVPVADVVGWEVCFMGPYSGASSIDTLVSNCDGDHLMLACKLSTENFYTLLAHAPRADVLIEQPWPYEPQVANGTGWYYDRAIGDQGGIGFVEAGDFPMGEPCDVEMATNPAHRLCWHVEDGAFFGGFRCGDVLWLNDSAEWQRIVLQRND